jgi:replicative DNA helicase
VAEIPELYEDDVLAVLCHAKLSAGKIVQVITPDMFSSRANQLIVEAIQKYYKEFQSPPGGHIYDAMDHTIKRTGETGKLIVTVLDRIRSLINKENFNERFVVKNISEFIRKSQLSQKAEKFAELVERNMLDEAEELLHKRLTKVDVFSVGTYLHEGDKILAFLDENPDDVFPVGIKELDDAGVTPARGTEYLFMAPPKMGKSWHMVHCGKEAMVRGRNVLHISLENSESITGRRYVQALYALARGDAKGSTFIPRLKRDEKGEISRAVRSEIVGRVMGDHNRESIRKRLNNLNSRGKGLVLIKRFPSGTLSVDQLDAYIHNLETVEGFFPDEVIVDYPDLMQIKSVENRRGELGRIFVDLRGIAVERDKAFVIATQSNRVSMTAKVITSDHASEDISKVATVDTLVTFNQTPYERRVNLARLYVAAARDAEDKFLVGIVQNYTHGQFCLDSWRYSDESVQRMIEDAYGIQVAAEDEERANRSRGYKKVSRVQSSDEEVEDGVPSRTARSNYSRHR